MKPRVFFASCAGVCLLLSVQPAAAQEAGVLEEIIVTAQKREQSLTDVPAAVSTVSGELVQEYADWGGGPLDSSASSPLVIGMARPDGSNWGDFNGLIDDVRIYNRAVRP